MSFSIDEKVVYPSHGVAVIEDIVEKNVAGSPVDFFKLNFLFKDMTILIPLSNVASTGVRNLTTSDDIDECLGQLHEFAANNDRIDIDMTPSGWNKRNKDYQFKLQSGTFIDVMAIYQELMVLTQQKDLSFGEKTLLHTSEELLAQEMVIVQGIDRSVALQALRAPFKQFVVSFTSTSSSNSHNNPTL